MAALTGPVRQAGRAASGDRAEQEPRLRHTNPTAAKDFTGKPGARGDHRRANAGVCLEPAASGSAHSHRPRIFCSVVHTRTGLGGGRSEAQRPSSREVVGK